MHDTSPDVLSKEHFELFKKQEKLPDDAGAIMNSLYLIKRMIDLNKYKSRGEQKKADKVYEKLEVKDGVILLEDEDHEIITKMLQDFEPYLTGRMYSPFFDAMENAEEVEVEAKPVSPEKDG